MTIGQRIKEARKSIGLTQRELAERSGTATGTIQQYELGKRQPRIEQLKSIASALNVDVNWLMNGQTLEERDQAWKDRVARRFEEAQAQADGSIRIHVSPERREYSNLLKKQETGAITDDEMRRMLELRAKMPSIQESIAKLNETMNRLGQCIPKLNDDGQQEAVKRIEELTEIPRYRRQDPAQPPAEAAPAQGTPAAQDAPEEAQKPKEGV